MVRTRQQINSFQHVNKIGVRWRYLSLEIQNTTLQYSKNVDFKNNCLKNQAMVCLQTASANGKRKLLPQSPSRLCRSLGSLVILWNMAWWTGFHHRSRTGHSSMQNMVPLLYRAWFPFLSAWHPLFEMFCIFGPGTGIWLVNIFLDHPGAYSQGALVCMGIECALILGCSSDLWWQRGHLNCSCLLDWAAQSLHTDPPATLCFWYFDSLSSFCAHALAWSEIFILCCTVYLEQTPLQS